VNRPCPATAVRPEASRGDVEEGPYTVENATLRAPGLVDFEISAGRGSPPLREEGILDTRKDKGEQRRRLLYAEPGCGKRG